ncbi:MAG: beta strand repeat-containing protein [Chthoniobacterales bacterium]
MIRSCLQRPFRWIPFANARFAVGLYAFFLLVFPGYSASLTWTGAAGDGKIATAGNWSPAVAPVAGDTLTFDGSAALSPELSANLTVGSLTFASGASAFTLGGTGIYTINAGGITNNSTSLETISNQISLGAAQTWTAAAGNLATTGNVNTNGRTLTVAGPNDTAISGVLSGMGGLTKTGSGVLTLSGANTFTGGTTLSAGVVKILSNAGLGTGAATVSSGAEFQFQGGVTVANTMTVNGNGTANRGALVNISGNNAVTGAITLGSAVTIGSDTGTLTASGAISGSYALSKVGAGTLTLGGNAANTYSGTTTVADGTLQLNKTAGRNAFAGALTIGDGTGNANSAETRWLASNQVPAVTITVNSDGSLNLNNFSDSIGALVLSGGRVATGTGTLTLGGNITSNGSATSGSIAGNLALGANRTFTIADGAAAEDLDISAIISGAYTLTKSGAGTMVLSGASTYTGLTTVGAGVLNIQHASGLGSTAGGTYVVAGGALQLEGGIAIGAEGLGLNGNGVAGNGALRNISGNNSYAGAVTLYSASTISSDAGTLTLSGTLANGGFGATFGGVGNVAASGVVSGLGSLTKTGAGTLTLSGANTYTGGTTVNGGTLLVNNETNLGSVLGALTLNAGTLEIASSFSTSRLIAVGSAASTFQVDAGKTYTVGTVISGSGALNKTGSGAMVLSAVNTYSGGTFVTEGTLQLGAVNRLLNTGAVTISGGNFDLQTFGQTTGAVTLASGSIVGTGTGILTASSYTLESGSVSAIMAGAGAVTKNTSGTVILSGANTFTGSTTINAGTLQVNSNNALGTTLAGTTVSNGAALKLNNVNYSTAEALTLNGSGISNGGALVNTGTSTYAGAITAATDATINAGGGTLNLTGGVAKNGTTLTIAGGGTVNITGNGITGSSPNSDLVVDGTTVVLSAASTYNGPTTVQNSGTLKLGASNVLPASPQTALTVNSSSFFDLASFSDGVASLTGDSTATVQNSAAGTTSTFAVNPAVGVSSTFAGVIAGTNGGTQGEVALIKDGAGTLVLTGSNTYGGSTTVNAGTLTAAGTGSALGATNSVTVNSGATLLLGANDQINDAAALTLAGGTFAKGDFSEGGVSAFGIDVLTLAAPDSTIDFGTGVTGTLAFAIFNPGSDSVLIENWTGSAGEAGDETTDRLIFQSDQTTNLGSFIFAGYEPGVMQFDLGGGYYEVAPMAAVPEINPAFVASALCALLGILYHRRLVRNRSKRE